MDETIACQNCGSSLPTRSFTMLFPGRTPPKVRHLCDDCIESSVLVKWKGQMVSWYTPQPHQRPYHESSVPNLLALGTRGTGKSKMMRVDAIIRCMTYEGFKVLILRRKMPDLRKSHLRYINAEMAALDNGVVGPKNAVGYYRETTTDVVFRNGSFMQFSHCENIKDVENYLSSEWDLIVFDELSSFPLEMFLTICAAARSPEGAPYVALVRAGSNPLGVGAAWMKSWFIDHDVDLAEYGDYLPDDYQMLFSTLDENSYVNRKEYEKRLKTLPEHVRRAWLLGEFVIEGAYFTDFQKKKRIEDADGVLDAHWHVIPSIPNWRGKSLLHPDLSWISIYRAVDWGYFPDPAVCLWIALLPNGRAVVFKERTWKRTLAAEVATAIKKESRGMKVVDTLCDPSMFFKDGATKYSIGEIFEQNGVPMTAAQNDREIYGYAIHDFLNTLVHVGSECAKEDCDPSTYLRHWRPRVQIVEAACPDLVRTLPILEMDASDPRKIANGPDHWAVALAYFCMSNSMPSKDPVETRTRRWMQRKHKRTYSVAA